MPTEAGKALLERLETIWTWMLQNVLASLPEDKYEWADVLGQIPYEVVKETLPAIEAEAAAIAAPPPGTRLILASENLLELFGARTDSGARLTAEWGEPDENGWYRPVFTATDDGWLDGIRAEAANAERERLRALINLIKWPDTPAALAARAVMFLGLDPEPAP